MQTDQYSQMLLERTHRDQRWENQIATNCTIKDLDVAEIQRVVDAAVQKGRLDSIEPRNPDDWLTGLGLCTEGMLYRATAVLFGKDEHVQTHYPQCLLRVARFDGVKITDEFLDNRQFRGNIFKLFYKAEQFIRESLPIAGKFESGSFERIDEPLFPLKAIREALANAFCHRDYSIWGGSVGVAIFDDRLEISSSGSLHFDLTPEKLFAPHESLLWNPLIAHCFYRRGIIEEWGTGTIKIARLLSSAGLPGPEIEDGAGRVVVRFRHNHSNLTRHWKSISGLDKQTVFQRREYAVTMILLHANEGLSFSEIQKRLSAKISPRQLRNTLDELRGRGAVSLTGRGKHARWRIA